MTSLLHLLVVLSVCTLAGAVRSAGEKVAIDEAIQAPVANATGGCTAQDKDKMWQLGGGNADGTFPKVTRDCGYEAYSMFSGFDPDFMRNCMRSMIGIGPSCARCFVGAGEYCANNCKAACLFSWCSQKCKDCGTEGRLAAGGAQACPFPRSPPVEERWLADLHLPSACGGASGCLCLWEVLCSSLSQPLSSLL
eukprot:CAMPEP_0171104496 /NCGR_PEP_ID=MMETSP0766_2-20121228/60750_1 /TAXON_ID=439317 /ORGANISM="Gambierdiscus australes, Strain CAWD 149" /LENGTH=193 /DNA_ID=CAMNT_0011565133 /DNA_START=21 /DNA_END=599 /DNA_ORIENTATION=+